MMLSDLKKEGREAAIKSPEKWPQIAEERRQRREHELKTLIKAETLTGGLLQSIENTIRERQNKTGGTMDPSTVQGMEKNGKMYLFWALVLSIASVASLLYSLSPFEIGSIAPIMAFGYSFVTIAGMEIVLKSYYESRTLILGLGSIFVVLSIFAHVQIGIIRGELIKAVHQTGEHAFYGPAVNLLGIAIPLISLAIEIGAGVLLFLALENLWGIDVRDYRNLSKCRKRMIKLSSKLEYYKNLPEIEYRTFLEGALEGEEELKRKLNSNQNKGKRNAVLIPFILILIILLALFSSKLLAMEVENTTVTVIDLSRSSRNRDYQGEITFKENLAGVENVIKGIEPDSRLIVIGITEKSFSNPLVILDSTIPREPGFFKEKIKSAREKLLKEWKEKSQKLRPRYRKSNIFGAIILAAHLLEGSNNGKLIIFSDLRHYGIGFDLESPNWLSPGPLLERVEQEGLVPRLHATEVYCLGVTSFGKSPKYFQTLREFWELYFKKAGAEIRKYSILRALVGG